MNKFSVTILSVFLVFLGGFFELGVCSGEDNEVLRMKLGGFHGCKGTQISTESLARFAVQEHNKKQNALLEFAKVLNAREQVVAGKIYHLTLEAVDYGKKNIYEAKVWVKPWMNFKQLQEFKRA